MLLLAVAWWLASPFTIRHARRVQRIGAFLGRPFGTVTKCGTRRASSPKRHLAALLAQRNHAAFERVRTAAENDFRDYRLRVGGLVEHPAELSFAEFRAMPRQEQITTHFCIQGWSGVAKWGGVPMRHILDRVKPTAQARYAVFYSLADGGDGRTLLRCAEHFQHAS